MRMHHTYVFSSGHNKVLERSMKFFKTQGTFMNWGNFDDASHLGISFGPRQRFHEISRNTQLMNRDKSNNVSHLGISLGHNKILKGSIKFIKTQPIFMNRDASYFGSFFSS